MACSGGADSVCLLHLLREIQSEYSLSLSVAHFNHSLRSEADADELFVKNLAKTHGLPFFRGKDNVKEYAHTRRLNLEEAGRERRYAFLKNTANKIGNTKIATAHTKTDQAETVLMRLLRGTGMRGLAGILPEAGANIVRPLLHAEREEIEEYLSQRKLSFREDSSNLDKRIFRNKIRLDLFPELQKIYSPQIVTHLSRLADMLREEEVLLESLVQEKSASVINDGGEGIRLDLGQLRPLPRALQRRLIREFLRRLRGDLRGISFTDIEDVLTLSDNKEWHLGNQVILKKEKGFLFLKNPVPSSKPFSYLWDPNLPLNIFELGMGFRGEALKNTDFPRLEFDDQAWAYIDRKKLRFPLLVRSRRKGDRYQPLGAPGRNKLKEIMRSKGIIPREREKHPVFVSGEDIVWVLGLSVSEKYKVTAETAEVFLIRKISGP